MLTPSLMLDFAACDRNLRRMADFFRHRRAKLRPHFKNHKCVTLARRQIAAGSAVGMTCAKLAEAEVLVAHGFRDILIANQVVGPEKTARLAFLACEARIGVAIDHVDHATALSQAAQSAGSTIDVLLEIDIGMGRCGLAPGPDALDLVRRIAPLPGLRFRGLQAFEGHLVNVIDRTERAVRSQEAMQRAIDFRRQLEKDGIPVECLTGCSTATYDSTGTLDGVDEVQAGTYATMDRQYRRLTPEFENALTVLATVISRPGPGQAVLDVGVKGAGAEFGPPILRDYPEAEIPYFLSEEHTIVRNAPAWPIGHQVHLIPTHACTTCNLHREIIVHDNGKEVDRWPIEASGKMW
jgi:D-serine deaminase-like pyridoxal phosphate-dependent protein